jgi:hypothetical protein
MLDYLTCVITLRLDKKVVVTQTAGSSPPQSNKVVVPGSKQSTKRNRLGGRKLKLPVQPEG